MSNMISEGNLTQLAKSTATRGALGLKDAVKYLRENARTRCVGETLARCCGMELSDKKALKKALLEKLVKTDPGLNVASMDKNVRNWLKDDATVIGRDNAIRLVYAFETPVSDADGLMVRLCGETFHFRDPEDLIWLYGLNNHLTYAKALALRDKASEAGLLNVMKDDPGKSMTSTVRGEAMGLTSEEELFAYLAEAAPRLGRLHNTAYQMFMEFMELLKNVGAYTPGSIPMVDKKDSEDSPIPQERKLSVSEIITTYMYNDYVPRAQGTGKKPKGVGNDVLSAIRRSIAMNWPDDTTLSKMKNREIDVTRKVMILLFMATDGGEGDYAEDWDYEKDEAFMEMYARLDLMLADCGFAPLDSRTPFDWMILYCMCADESIFLDDYVRGFLTSIFSEETEPAND